MKDKILILDFGSQYTQLIARRVREQHVYSEIHPYNYPLDKIKEFAPSGIILSGSPASLTLEESPQLDPKVLDCGVPVLGICYGMQSIAAKCGGKVHSSKEREYGRVDIEVETKCLLFAGLPKSCTVWMSHGDKVLNLPKGFKAAANSANSPFAAMVNEEKRLYGVQFHPEVTHTPLGKEII